MSTSSAGCEHGLHPLTNFEIEDIAEGILSASDEEATKQRVLALHSTELFFVQEGIRNAIKCLLFNDDSPETDADVETDADAIRGTAIKVFRRPDSFGPISQRTRLAVLMLFIRTNELFNKHKFEIQYKSLPASNVLDPNSTWETVEQRLSDPASAEKLKEVQGLQNGGQLYAIMEDGSVEFKDEGPYPVMFLRDKATKKVKLICNLDPQEMSRALDRVLLKNTAEWLTTSEMLEWARDHGYEVFSSEPDPENPKGLRIYGKLMRLAENASPTGAFIGIENNEGAYIESALEDGYYASYDPNENVPGWPPRYGGRLSRPDRNDRCGLVRRVNI